MLTKEKEDLIRKLLNEGHPSRDIARNAHCSLNVVSRIRKEMTGETIKTDLDMKRKSICSRVFASLQKGISLPQIVIDEDIEPELAIKIQEKYFNLIGKGKIVSLLIDQKYMTLIIDLVQFLVENPHHRRKIKKLVDLQRVIWELKAEKEDVEEDLGVSITLEKYYDSQVEAKRKKILKKRDSQFQSNYL